MSWELNLPEVTKGPSGTMQVWRPQGTTEWKWSYFICSSSQRLTFGWIHCRSNSFKTLGQKTKLQKNRLCDSICCLWLRRCADGKEREAAAAMQLFNPQWSTSGKWIILFILSHFFHLTLILSLLFYLISLFLHLTPSFFLYGQFNALLVSE